MLYFAICYVSVRYKGEGRTELQFSSVQSFSLPCTTSTPDHYTEVTITSDLNFFLFSNNNVQIIFNLLLTTHIISPIYIYILTFIARMLHRVVWIADTGV